MVGKSKSTTSKDSASDQKYLDERLHKLKQLTDRLSDLLEDEPESTAVALTDLAIATLARVYPAKLSEMDKKKIKDNYPDVTESLMNERSMSEYGAIFTVATAMQMARIALDYCPESHVKDTMDSDMRLHGTAGKELATKLSIDFQAAVVGGLSPFGASATMILQGVFLARSAKVDPIVLIRPLIDGFNVALKQEQGPTEKELEDMAIDYVSKQMRISKSEARKYMQAAKEMKKE